MSTSITTAAARAPRPILNQTESADSATSLLDPGQVAARLNVPKSWVYAAAEREEIPSRKVGKYLRFVPEEIETWLNGQQKR